MIFENKKRDQILSYKSTNGHTYLKNLVVFTTQDFLNMFGQHKRINILIFAMIVKGNFFRRFFIQGILK